MTIQALSQLIIYLLILFTLGYFLSGYIMQRMQAPISRLESRGLTPAVKSVQLNLGDFDYAA